MSWEFEIFQRNRHEFGINNSSSLLMANFVFLIKCQFWWLTSWKFVATRGPSSSQPVTHETRLLITSWMGLWLQILPLRIHRVSIEIKINCHCVDVGLIKVITLNAAYQRQRNLLGIGSTWPLNRLLCLVIPTTAVPPRPLSKPLRLGSAWKLGTRILGQSHAKWEWEF